MLAGCSAGSAAPVPCPPGSFQGDQGRSSCTACPPGSFQSSEGGTRCQDCPLGTYTSSNGSAGCTACLDRLSSYPGSAACDVCDRGFFYLTSLTALSQSDCRECRADRGRCPIGTTLATISIHPGHWRLSNRSSIIYACEGSSGTERCKGGNDAGIDGEGYCGSNYTGPE